MSLTPTSRLSSVLDPRTPSSLRPRRSGRVSFRTVRSASTIGLDIGGTRVKAGAVDWTGQVLEQTNRPSPTTSPAAVEDVVVGIVEDLATRHDVRAVGVGAAGFVDADRSTVLFSPHLAWRNEELRDTLQDRLGVRVVVENDANAAAWAEAQFGAGRGETHMVLLTLGTGIGGGIVTHGELERGRGGMAGEFGHMLIVPDGKRCECGNRGCWEQYAGGSALIKNAREVARGGGPYASSLLRAVDGDADALTGLVVTECAREGDPASLDLLHDMGTWLGTGLANLAAALDAGLFVIGGGVAGAGELLLEPARASFARTLTGRGYRTPPRIVGAELGNDAGFVGAADLARYELSATPRRRGMQGASLSAARRLSPRRTAPPPIR